MRMEKILTELMRAAGRIMLSAHLEEDNSDGAVSEKTGSANFVTKYDVAVQEFLMEEIKMMKCVFSDTETRLPCLR